MNASFRAIAAIVLSVIASAVAAAQSPRAPSSAPAYSPAPASAFASLPAGFRGVELGMGLDEVKGILKRDGLIDYEGAADVSLLPEDKGELIDARGRSFIKRASFQFSEGRLWAMSFALDATLVDHYSVFRTMVEKYGNPGKIDPLETVWEDGSVRVSIERPLTLKYIDVRAFERLKGKSGVEKAFSEELRADFLEGL